MVKIQNWSFTHIYTSIYPTHIYTSIYPILLVHTVNFISTYGPFTLDLRTKFKVHQMCIPRIHTWIQFGQCALDAYQVNPPPGVVWMHIQTGLYYPRLRQHSEVRGARIQHAKRAIENVLINIIHEVAFLHLWRMFSAMRCLLRARTSPFHCTCHWLYSC